MHQFLDKSFGQRFDFRVNARADVFACSLAFEQFGAFAAEGVAGAVVGLHHVLAFDRGFQRLQRFARARRFLGGGIHFRFPLGNAGGVLLEQRCAGTHPIQGNRLAPLHGRLQAGFLRGGQLLGELRQVVQAPQAQGGDQGGDEQDQAKAQTQAGADAEVL